jgi:GDP-L-fucose synthase
MPTNLYGPGDNFDLLSSHVIPAMIRKFHEAKVASGEEARVALWGTGSARREFLHVDDLASAALYVAGSGSTGLLNVGSGTDLSIRDLAGIVAEVVGYAGRVEWDPSKPDGTPQKLLDSTRLSNTGWAPTISLRRGLQQTYEWYLAHGAIVAG